MAASTYRSFATATNEHAHELKDVTKSSNNSHRASITPGSYLKSRSRIEPEEEFQVDPSSLSAILSGHKSVPQENSRHTMAPSTQKPVEVSDKRGSIYYGALRVPVKSTGAAPTGRTPGRPQTSQPRRLVAGTATPGAKQRSAAPYKSIATPSRTSYVASTTPHKHEQRPTTPIHVRKLSFEEANEIATTSVQSVSGDTTVRARSLSAPKILGSPLAKQQPKESISLGTQEHQATQKIEPLKQTAPTSSTSVTIEPIPVQNAVVEKPITKEEIKSRLLANQQKRRQLLTELQKVDEENSELLTLLQNL